MIFYYKYIKASLKRFKSIKLKYKFENFFLMCFNKTVISISVILKFYNSVREKNFKNKN